MDFSKYANEDLKAQYDKLVGERLRPLQPVSVEEAKRKEAAFQALKDELKKRGVIV